MSSPLRIRRRACLLSARLVVLPTLLPLTSQSILCDRGDPPGRQLGIVVSEVVGVVLSVVPYVSMYVIHVFVFLYALYCIAPAWVFLLYLFISSSVVFIYLLYSLGDVFYFPALVIS